MKKKFSFKLDVVVSSDIESDFETVLNNMKILPTMIEDLSLCTDGTEASLVSIKSDVAQKHDKRGRPKKAEAIV